MKITIKCLFCIAYVRNPVCENPVCENPVCENPVGPDPVWKPATAGTDREDAVKVLCRESMLPLAMR